MVFRYRNRPQIVQKHTCISKEEGRSSLPEGEWEVTESQREMTQDKVKFVCQGATPWKTGTFLKGRVEFFTEGWVSWYWVTIREDAGWSKMFTPRCNALKNEYLPENIGWVLYWRVSELLRSPKGVWRRIKWNLFAHVQRPENWASSWEERLSPLPVG